LCPQSALIELLHLASGLYSLKAEANWRLSSKKYFACQALCAEILYNLLNFTTTKCRLTVWPDCFGKTAPNIPLKLLKMVPFLKPILRILNLQPHRHPLT
jgi:hypothetical protein